MYIYISIYICIYPYLSIYIYVCVEGRESAPSVLRSQGASQGAAANTQGAPKALRVRDRVGKSEYGRRVRNQGDPFRVCDGTTARVFWVLAFSEL